MCLMWRLDREDRKSELRTIVQDVSIMGQNSDGSYKVFPMHPRLYAMRVANFKAAY
jgi:hypothetical protein